MVKVRHRLYPIFASACVAQGLAFSLAVWATVQFRVVTANSNMPLPGFETLCYVLLFCWPAWVIVLWRSSARWFQALAPMLGGFLGMAPGLFVWAVFASLGRGC
jgi:hypothetical protein